MDRAQRMSDEGVVGDDLAAVCRRHRYEVAAELLAGRRVADLWCGTGDGAAILGRTARSVVGVEPDPRLASRAAAPDGLPVTFEQGDVCEWLAAGGGDADAVVCLPGLDSVPAPEAVMDLLAERARAGAAVIVSAGPSTGWLLDRLGQAVVLHQRFVEGSLITDAAGAREDAADGAIGGLAGAGGRSSRDRLAVLGVDAERIREGLARRPARVTAARGSQLEELEHANRSLRRANAMLGRDVFGTWDSAAAAFLARHTDEVKRLEAELAELRERAARAEYSAWENDQWLQAERRHNQRLRSVESRLRGVAGIVGGRPGRASGADG